MSEYQNVILISEENELPTFEALFGREIEECINEVQSYLELGNINYDEAILYFNDKKIVVDVNVPINSIVNDYLKLINSVDEKKDISGFKNKFLHFLNFESDDPLGYLFYLLFCGLLFLFVLFIIDSTSCSLNVNQTENKPQQIHKENVTVNIRDTLNFDNRNFSIIVIDSIEYLCYKNGSKLEIIKHKEN